MIWGGTVIHEKDIDETKYRLQSVVPIDDETFLGIPITDTFEGVDEYLNHSCEPNVWLIDEVTIVARRDIKPGEEITLDCATWDCDENWSYTHDGKCRCGSKICRKILTHSDWTREDVQKKYREHFSPYIQRKIDALHASVRTPQ
jgi:uncharacterized protein